MMAAKIDKLIHAGANIIGGCFGTTPDHIRALAEAIEH
jgi:5-methyltetrahydrofolate--homocysteine methyltransferase